VSVAADGTAMPGHGVVITGGASGIGLATAERVVALGGCVALIDRDAEASQREAARLGAAGAKAVGLGADVTDPAAIGSALAAAADRLGRLDGVVTSAGIRQPSARVADMSLEVWQRTLRSHLDGTFLTLQAAARIMGPARTGAIVTISSMSGNSPRLGQAAYCASKAGIVLLTKVLALELAESGVRVNAVCPGTVKTPFNQEALEREGEVGVRARVFGDPATFRPGIPLRRLAEAHEVAATIAFLLSPAAAMITGQAIFVDGGESVF
jgi:2,3-dihydro-2,3-dihydroxybenzoate dehydrogenase